jgi:hypothetical protein
MAALHRSDFAGFGVGNLAETRRIRAFLFGAFIGLHLLFRLFRIVLGFGRIVFGKCLGSGFQRFVIGQTDHLIALEDTDLSGVLAFLVEPQGSSWPAYRQIPSRRVQPLLPIRRNNRSGPCSRLLPVS